MSEKLYKVLLDGKSCHGGSQEWPLPKDGQPGEWVEYAGELEPCRRGLHLTKSPVVWYDRSGLAVYEAETDGEQVACSDDKVVCRRVRLVKELSHGELAKLGIFLSGVHDVNTGKVWASDSATVRAYGSATVWAYGSATVEAYDSATVEAYDSATVRASGSATVWASDSATVWAYDSATVRASGSATVNSYSARNAVQVFEMAVHLKRDEYKKVVVRCVAGAAVSLEPAVAAEGK